MTNQQEAAVRFMVKAQDDLQKTWVNYALSDYPVISAGHEALKRRLDEARHNVDVATEELRQVLEHPADHIPDAGKMVQPVAWWNPKKDTVSTDPVHRNNPDCVPLVPLVPLEQRGNK